MSDNGESSRLCGVKLIHGYKKRDPEGVDASNLRTLGNYHSGGGDSKCGEARW